MYEIIVFYNSFVSLFREVSSNMKSLKELAKMAVLKQGLGSEECIPVTVREELKLMEQAIRKSMTGRGYYDNNDIIRFLEFDIDWSEGCWSFLLRKRTENRWTETSTKIRAKTRSFLPPEWADLFGINYTPTMLHGSWIKDFKMNIDERRVTFYGNFGSPYDDETANEFSTQFWFSHASCHVRIKTLEWDPVACSYITVTDRWYEQSDDDTCHFWHFPFPHLE